MRLAELEIEMNDAVESTDPPSEICDPPAACSEGPAIQRDACSGGLCRGASSADTTEYEFLYRPTMVAVYTARHQRMPKSDRALREHVFGCCGHAGCEACREETEFLVAHQRKFF